MRRASIVFAVLVVALATMAGVPGSAAPSSDGPKIAYSVLYQDGVSLAAGRAAVSAAGGTVVEVNKAVGLARVESRNPAFLDDVARQPALYGAARNVPIGYAPGIRPKDDGVERDRVVGSEAPAAPSGEPDEDPLSGLQWDMDMIDADDDGSYAVQQGDPRVLVGIIDTGIDGHHPDIEPNFDANLSRNFTVDIPLVDGPCEEEPDMSCNDPADVDEAGHGTHVAGTVAAALNGLGTIGVAPDVTLVNVRAGQDSGYFFLMESVNALTYSGDIGIDVVNMSYFIDPWLYNCADNPADSKAAQREQRTIIAATQRALRYAHMKGVTLVAAEGNQATDLGHPKTDDISPDFPPGSEYHRNVDNSCLTMPAEGNHVIAVSALGPTTRKAYYSNYGVEQTTVSAPGGDRREYYGTPQWNAVENRQLSTYPYLVALANGELNEDGTPNTPFVMRNCVDGVCAYYSWFQGTSMAAPHAVGVAALIVSEYGTADPGHPGGLTMQPNEVQQILEDTATNHRCPRPRLFHYPDPDLPPEIYDALCQGSAEFNGFYGHGIVNALAAVGG